MAAKTARRRPNLRLFEPSGSKSMKSLVTSALRCVNRLLTKLWPNHAEDATMNPLRRGYDDRTSKSRNDPEKGETRTVRSGSGLPRHQPGQGRVKSVSYSSLSNPVLETRMADVIRLKDHPARSLRRTPNSAQKGAEAVVLMFTGIRYERIGEQSPPPRDMTQPLNNSTTH